MELLEQQIIIQCQKGKLEEFEKLYEGYFEKIYRFIYFRTHHKETTEDLTSQTFMKALEKIQTFESVKGSFSGWIYRIARNNVIDHYRTKKKNTDILDVWDLHSDKDIERDIETKEKLEKVIKYLENIDREHREILIMRLWDGLSYQEIAPILGKKEANCRVIFSRTIGRLRKEVVLSLILTSLTLQ